MIDKDFELQGEAAERLQLKKLTAEDIPEGYNYAAVNENGIAYAYKTKPGLFNSFWAGMEDCAIGGLEFLGRFDASDWRNSLVSRIPAERPYYKKLTAGDILEGYRYAAVDSDGRANCYKDLPELFEFQYDSAFDSKVKYLDHKKFIGIGYDKTDWRNSLVIRETAERPQAKKLTAADIPDGFSYAAVNKNGSGYAFKKRPLLSGLFWAGDCEIDGYEFLGGFDSSDWVNSLVIRETGEQQAAEPKALKDQENKPSFLEIDPNFLEAMAWRMTSNKGKYPPNNWQRPHDLLLDVDAIYRHLNDIKRQLEGGKSLTGESIQKHCAAIACNAMFLFYHTQEDQWQRAARSRQSNAKEI